MATEREGTRKGGELSRRGEAGTMRTGSRDPWYTPPFETMRRMMQDMTRMLEGTPYLGFQGPAGSGWPPLEVYEREGRLVVRAELPGLSREDVHVRMEEDMLVIEGERRHESESGQGEFYESEWSYGRFERRVPVPGNVDPEQVVARFQDGILEVKLPMPTPSAREIPIRTGTESAEERSRESYEPH